MREDFGFPFSRPRRFSAIKVLVWIGVAEILLIASLLIVVRLVA